MTTSIKRIVDETTIVACPNYDPIHSADFCLKLALYAWDGAGNGVSYHYSETPDNQSFTAELF